MNKQLVPILVCAILSIFISSLGAQYNPNYRLTNLKKYVGDPVGNPFDDNIFHYASPTATYPDSIYDYVYSGTDICTEIDFNAQGLKQEIRSYSELSPNEGNVYHIEYDPEGRPTMSYCGVFLPSPYPDNVSTRNYYTYNENRLSSIIRWEYDPSYGSIFYKSAFNYDDDGNPIEELIYMSPDSTSFSLMDLMGRRVWTYEDGRSGDLMAKLDAWAAYFYPSTVHPLHPTHQPSSEIKQQSFYPDWIDREKFEYSYDAGNKLTQQLTYVSNGGSWILGRTETFTYDAEGNLQYQSFSDRSGTYEYLWENINPNSIDNPELPRPALELTSYPQPFTDRININFKSDSPAQTHLEIFNLRGQKLRSWNAHPGDQMVWDGKDEQGVNCSSGIYLIRAKQNGVSITKRLVRQK